MSSYSDYLKTKNVCCSVGPPGPQGLRGPTGLIGPTGPTGSVLYVGETGPIGVFGGNTVLYKAAIPDPNLNTPDPFLKNGTFIALNILIEPEIVVPQVNEINGIPSMDEMLVSSVKGSKMGKKVSSVDEYNVICLHEIDLQNINQENWIKSLTIGSKIRISLNSDAKRFVLYNIISKPEKYDTDKYIVGIKHISSSDSSKTLTDLFSTEELAISYIEVGPTGPIGPQGIAGTAVLYTKYGTGPVGSEKKGCKTIYSGPKIKHIPKDETWVYEFYVFVVSNNVSGNTCSCYSDSKLSIYNGDDLITTIHSGQSYGCQQTTFIYSLVAKNGDQYTLETNNGYKLYQPPTYLIKLTKIKTSAISDAEYCI
jgi:hypothetical protein